MATVIISSNVWNRIYEYYDNVAAKYPNTWDINDTLEQIDKIQWVVRNFESVCSWSREPIISYWKLMGWKETWHKSSPWHFAFECKSIDGKDYIFIQNAEHQDVVKESYYVNQNQIIDESLKQTLSLMERIEKLYK